MERAVVRFGLYGDFTRIGELNGVADEIDQDLRQAAAVTVPWRQFAGKLKLECELLVSRQRLQRARLVFGLCYLPTIVIALMDFK